MNHMPRLLGGAKRAWHSRVPVHLLGARTPTVSQMRWNSSKSAPIQDSPVVKTSGESTAGPASALTHVKSSGEAHMVDIGAKSSTRRVAIACATVLFSNGEPFRLISDNSNKKGDVLGVARIAGIMAAKRTSDLIPLCHPINISKAEVEVELVASGDAGLRVSGNANTYGAAVIQSRVECVGPTGIEMEAMTAAMGAALTVYDMCKAVDRGITVASATLLYKSGGKSGIYVDEQWAGRVGREFFVEHKLEVPESLLTT